MEDKTIANVIVRKYEERDRQNVRHLCVASGIRAYPVSIVFEDEEVLPLLFSDYYLDYEPESCFVAEMDGRVVGYSLGCKDTRRYHRVLARKILPRLYARVLVKLTTLQYRKKCTYDTLWWGMMRSWREHVPIPFKAYPGHTHTNVDEGSRGKQVGFRLFKAMRKHMVEYGIPGLHTMILEEAGDERLSRHFCTKRGYRILMVKRSSLLENATGKVWLTKLLVCDLMNLGGSDAFPGN